MSERPAGRLPVLITLLTPLAGFLAAIVLLWRRWVFPLDLWLLGGMYVITVLGLTAGYHRLFTIIVSNAVLWSVPCSASPAAWGRRGRCSFGWPATAGIIR